MAGPYLLWATATDAAGNTGTSVIEVQVAGGCREDGNCPPADGRLVPPSLPPLPPEPGKNGRYLQWALLMVRIFSTDPLRCSCGGRLRLVAMVMAGAGAERYLRGTGLATDAQRARSPPTYVLDAGAPA